MHEPKKNHAKESLIDQISDDFDSFESGIIGHWKTVTAIALGVIVVVAAFAITKHILKQKEAEALRAFAAAQTVDALNQQLSAYPNHVAAAAGRAKLAGLYLAQKEYGKALTELQTLAKMENADFFLRSRASLDAAYILELQGKNDEAVAAFEAVAANPRITEDFKAEAIYSAGRIYAQKNDIAKAGAALERLNPDQGMSPGRTFIYMQWAKQAKALLNRLPAEAASGK